MGQDLGRLLSDAATAGVSRRRRRRQIRADTSGPGAAEKAVVVEAQRAVDFPDEPPYPYG